MQSLTCDLDYSALTVAAEFTCSMTVAVMAACSVNRLGAGNNGVYNAHMLRVTVGLSEHNILLSSSVKLVTQVFLRMTLIRVLTILKLCLIKGR